MTNAGNYGFQTTFLKGTSMEEEQITTSWFKDFWNKYKLPLRTFIQTAIMVGLLAAGDAILNMLNGETLPTDLKSGATIVGATAISAIMQYVRSKAASVTANLNS